MYQIFVVEDHPFMQEAFQALVQREPDLTICGQTSTGEEALRLLPESGADVVLVDVSLKHGMDGIELVSRLQSVMPELAVLVVSGHDESLYAGAAFAAGARGYLMKHNTREIVPAIRQLLQGNHYGMPSAGGGASRRRR